MSAARPLLWGATGLVLGGVGAFAFALPGRADDVSPWWTLLVFVPVGGMFALVSRPQRWWVALGFAWLLAAWVEAGQAVWLAETGRARVIDLLLGCVGGTVGVAIVVGGRALAAHSRAVRAAAAVRAGAPEVARPSAAAAAPRIR
ncbi:MAG: hypothetical protein BGO95_03670 [Micrococcales bacterium 73-13]|nr:MAG: hypothetical protein BGO95_03670 [Micrococcales bacterium 73-13]